MILEMISYLFCMICYVCVSKCAYRIYKLLNHGNYWWVICTSFILMAFRSALGIISLTITPIDMNTNSLYLMSSIFIPVAISITLVLGMKRMYNAAKITSLAEKKAMIRMKRINKIQVRMDRYERKKITEVQCNAQAIG